VSAETEVFTAIVTPEAPPPPPKNASDVVDVEGLMQPDPPPPPAPISTTNIGLGDAYPSGCANVPDDVNVCTRLYNELAAAAEAAGNIDWPMVISPLLLGI
jgi:hypothetical protein